MTEFDSAIRAVYQRDYDFLGSYLTDHATADADEDGRTLLMHAVLADEADTQMVQYLINYGVPVNFADRQNWTALHFAARDKRPEIVELILKAGANVDAEDSYGNTPLARSLNQLPFDTQTIGLLIAAGANPCHGNHNGKSPLDLARLMENKELEELLLTVDS